MYQGYDLLIPSVIVPFEVNPPVTLGKLTLNRNPTNYFAEPESISFAPSNVVDGVSFVPDPLLQWRLMSYDDTATHRHNSPNGYTLPINRPIAPLNYNYRDGYMQPYLYEGASTSTPNGVGGVQEPSVGETLSYAIENAGAGPIGRYVSTYDWFGQARIFWGSLDVYAQQHTVDAYRFELGNVADLQVVQKYIDNTLNSIDNCLARRVAFGVGAEMPAAGSGPSTNLTASTTPFSSLYPLNPGQEPKKSNDGLTVAAVASATRLSSADVQAIISELSQQKVGLAVVAPRIGVLQTGVTANASFITTSDIFYDAVFIGSAGGSNSSYAAGANGLTSDAMNFVMEAYGHGKAIGALGSSGSAILKSLGIDGKPGVYSGDAGAVASGVLTALSGPVRFPQRFSTDDVEGICG